MNEYQQALEDRKQQHLFRELPLVEDGIDFFSNDYLGLARSEKLAEEIDCILENQPLSNGATGSRLLSGNSKLALDVEEKIASTHKAEAALIYGSGYAANLGLISSLATRHTTLLMDELLHASLIDGARLGRAERIRFKHNDVLDLEKRLITSSGERLVIVESVYSMDGDLCPLEEVAAICQKHQAKLIVDEAHGIGVFGNSGLGLVEDRQLEKQVFARIITYGKAPGIHGAAVVGPRWLKDYQVNFSRPLIFSTAPSPHQLAAISAFYNLVSSEDRNRKELHGLVDYFVKKRILSLPTWVNSPSHIQSLIVPGNEEVMKLASKLRDKDINALPIRKPSVTEGTERIRFCLHSYNTKEEIDLLFALLSAS